MGPRIKCVLVFVHLLGVEWARKALVQKERKSSITQRQLQKAPGRNILIYLLAQVSGTVKLLRIPYYKNKGRHLHSCFL